MSRDDSVQFEGSVPVGLDELPKGCGANGAQSCGFGEVHFQLLAEHNCSRALTFLVCSADVLLVLGKSGDLISCFLLLATLLEDLIDQSFRCILRTLFVLRTCLLEQCRFEVFGGVGVLRVYLGGQQRCSLLRSYWVRAELGLEDVPGEADVVCDDLLLDLHLL